MGSAGKRFLGNGDRMVHISDTVRRLSSQSDGRSHPRSRHSRDDSERTTNAHDRLDEDQARQFLTGPGAESRFLTRAAMGSRRAMRGMPNKCGAIPQ